MWIVYGLLLSGVAYLAIYGINCMAEKHKGNLLEIDDDFPYCKTNKNIGARINLKKRG